MCGGCTGVDLYDKERDELTDFAELLLEVEGGIFMSNLQDPDRFLERISNRYDLDPNKVEVPKRDLIQAEYYRLKYDIPEHCPHSVETDDSCLFHLAPEKREAAGISEDVVRDRFVAAIEGETSIEDGRNRKSFVNASFDRLDLGYEVIESENKHQINLSFVNIDQLIIQNAVLEEHIRFDRAQIGRCEAERASFLYDVSFEHVTFSDSVTFDEARFSGTQVTFECAEFLSTVQIRNASFECDAAFDETTFGNQSGTQTVRFDDTTFSEGSVSFRNTNFGYRAVSSLPDEGDDDNVLVDVSFQGTCFRDGKTDFGNARFVGTAKFRYTKFEGNTISFNSTNFYAGTVYFEQVNFDALKITFSNALFRNSQLTFNQVRFRADNLNFSGRFHSRQSTTFEGTQFDCQYVDFSGAEFGEQSVEFTGVMFLGQEVSFDNAVFDVANEVSFKHVRFACRRISFVGATFSCHEATFQHAEFECRTAVFRDTTFDCERVSFADSSYTSGSVRFTGVSSQNCPILFHDAKDVQGRFVLPDVDTVYEFDRATVGDLTLDTDSEISEGTTSQPRLFRQFRFLKTKFDGFDFSRYNDELAATNWRIHTTAPGETSLVRTDGGLDEQSLGDLASTYMHAKNGASDAGDEKASAEFFRHEMQFRRKQYAKQMQNWRKVKDNQGWREAITHSARAAWYWCGNTGLWLISGYGERPISVVATSLIVIIASAFVFEGLWFGLDVTRPISYSGLFGSIVLSLESFTTLVLGGGAVGPLPIRLFAYFEGFIGAFLIAMFVFTLTRSIRR